MTATLDPLSTTRAGTQTWPRGLESFAAGTGLSLGSTSKRILQATGFSAGELREAVANAYADLVTAIGRSPHPHPIRFWNYLPSIDVDMGSGLSRYKVFNAGRLDGFERTMTPAEIKSRVATASAVGHDGSDLVIQCLSAGRPGRAVANPRQVDPVRYSARYGPRPPCFARATAVDSEDGSSQLFVGGTASIRGEDSLHRQQLIEQIDETLVNLSAVVTAASPGVTAPLSRFVELRVYHPSPAASPMLRERVTSHFPNVTEIEFTRADLCRAELLVEIEGLATL